MYKYLKNNQGLSTLIIGIIVALCLLLIGGGAFAYIKIQEQKAEREKNIARVEELDKELFELLDKENIVKFDGSKYTPMSRSDIRSVIDDIESNLEEYEEIYEKLNDKDIPDLTCKSHRTTNIEISFLDNINRTFLEDSGYSSDFFVRDYFNNSDSKIKQYKREYERNCEKLYKELGIEIK